MYWEPDNECMHREELEQLQLVRLQATLNRVYGRVPFYRKKLEEKGIRPGDIRYSYVHYAKDYSAASPLGYGPSAADPRTGEIISGTANIPRRRSTRAPEAVRQSAVSA